MFLKKISGAKSVIVPLTQMGINYLPFVEDLRDRQIKYIDFVAVTSLPGSAASPLTEPGNCTITLANKSGNTYDFSDLPLARFSPAHYYGIRPFIGRKISLQNSFIKVNDAAAVGKNALLVFYFDEPEFSYRNTSNDVSENAIEVPIVSNIYPNQLPDNRTMVGKRFRNISINPVLVTPSYKESAYSDISDLYLSLYNGNVAILDRVPLSVFNTAGTVENFTFSNIRFDFTNSYVLVGGAGTVSDPVGKSLLINLSYENK